MWHYVWNVGILLAISVFLYGLHPLSRWQLRHIPGPKYRWLIGNFGSFLSLRGIHWVYVDWARQYGPVFQVWWGATPTVVVSEPELGRLLVLRNVDRITLKGPPDLLSGRDHEIQTKNLAVMKGNTEHRDVKNAWLPMFNSASLEASCSLINQCADCLCSSLAKHAANGSEIDIWREYGKLTMGVVGTVAFGVDLHTQDTDDSKNSEAATKLISAAQRLLAQNPFGGDAYAALLLLFPFLVPVIKAVAKVFPDSEMRKMTAARNLVYETSLRLMETARKQAAAVPPALDTQEKPEMGKADSPAGVGPAPSLQARKHARAVKPGSFMHLLMRARHTADNNPFTDIEIIAQAFIFLLAGYETTANTLAFTTYALAANPDKVAKLFEEIGREAHKGEITADHLLHMPYLEACIKEALRLYPPAVMLSRTLGEATVIKGCRIPKGTGLMVPTFAIHHSPHIYADAESFKPERWIEGTPEYAADKRIPGRFMPFGDGTRVCVGQRLALLEAKIVIAHVFRRFTFKLSPGQIPLQEECRMLLKPKTGVFVTPVLRPED